MQPRILGALLALAAVIAGGLWWAAWRPPDPFEAGERLFRSPIKGTPVSTPTIAVTVALPTGTVRRSLSWTFNGEPWEDPMAELRRRNGEDDTLLYLGELDLQAVPAGIHELRVAFDQEIDGYTVARELATRFRYDHPPHRVDVTVVDGDGTPVDARLFLVQSKDLVTLGRLASGADSHGRDREQSSVFALNGRQTLWLDEGTWRIVAVRGVRSEVGVQAVEVSGDTEVRLIVPQVIDTPGQLTADLHVHTVESSDATIPHRARFASLVAADLDVVAITDHNVAWDARPVAALLPSNARLEVLPGVELNLHGEGKNKALGHINAIPQITNAELEEGADVPMGAHLDALRAHHAEEGADLGGPFLLQLNHPRGIQFKIGSEPVRGSHAIFNAVGYDRNQPVGEGRNAWMTRTAEGGTSRAIDYDAMEIMNRFSWELYKDVRRDWYALWRQGYQITGTGNSDSHAAHVELAGMPTNLVDISPWPDLPQRDAFLRAVIEGRVSVSTGPIVDLVVRCGELSARPGEMLDGSCGEIVAEARIRSASWVPTRVGRLVVDGEIVASEEIDNGRNLLDVTLTWPVLLTVDGFVTAEAGWPLDEDDRGVPEPYSLIAPGYVPVGWSNPVRVDRDGDGVWVAPGVF
jgi:hypothetical protein